MSETAVGTGRDGTKLRRVAGCDLGKATAKFVVLRLDRGTVVEVERTSVVEHDGEPLEAFRCWYREACIADSDGLGATGVYASELAEAPRRGVSRLAGPLPEQACLLSALSVLPEPFASGPLNIISIGARGYAVLVRDERGHVRALENDKCSSGTGETMVKIASRFGLDIEAADQLAQSATASIPITARCSVFAKSEMTHFGNQGRPPDALFRGYFASVANHVAALLARARVKGPVLVIGGGTRIGALLESLGAAVGQRVIAPRWRRDLRLSVGTRETQTLLLEAVGAGILASEQLVPDLDRLPADPTMLIKSRRVRFVTLDPPKRWAHRVVRLPERASIGGAGRPTIVGLDLGSTGSKAVLVDIDSGEAIADIYDRTRGNPVNAARRLVSTLLEKGDEESEVIDVRAIGLTGSGREAAAAVVNAVYPELAERVVVLNEIVAHATAAIRCDPDCGKSLSVVEIGGQDAKFIQIEDGQIVESDMNKACSAGTGSFLEEQAVFYGIDNIEVFTRMARRADRPPDLGQMCTVYVATAAAAAHNEGFSIEDIFGGFQYSVIHNYINRAMGQRTFGKRIFFQGKPATGESLAWTLAAVTGREVMVPPNPGAMGAWGIGLCARAAVSAKALAGPPFDLRALLDASVVERSEFQCHDRRCTTLCTIERTIVDVGRGRPVQVLSGGACPKYEIPGSRDGRVKLQPETPNAFEERRALLTRFINRPVADPGPPPETTIGIPAVGACHGVLPWLVTFVKQLGLHPGILGTDAHSLTAGEQLCYSFDACAPVKIAHGVVGSATGIDRVLFPKLLSLGNGNGCSGKTCPLEQALPEMVQASLRARGRNIEVINPHLSLDVPLGSRSLLTQARTLAERLGTNPRRLPAALIQADAAQCAYEAELTQIGRRTLEHARCKDLPVVLVCGCLHVIHDAVVNAGIPRLLRKGGVLVLPMDCIPIPETAPAAQRIMWAEPRRALRAAFAARKRGDVYPLWLSSFGCGPGSFNEQVFSRLMRGYPHSVLESDGHGGTAGYTTRVQAFLHTVGQHDRVPSPAPHKALALLEPLPNRPILKERETSRLVLFSAGRVAALLAATFRAFGFDAIASPPASDETLRLGHSDCSGKECLPYQLIWGSFRKHLQDHPPDRRTLLIQLSGEGLCRNCMFSIKDRISLERLGLDGQTVVPRHLRMEPELGWPFFLRVLGGLLAWDILFQLVSYYRAFETLGWGQAHDEGACDALYERYFAELEALLERPIPSMTLGGLIDGAHSTAGLETLIERASSDFARLSRSRCNLQGRRSNGNRGTKGALTVLLSGDIYLRIDEFSNDHLIRRLNRRGMAVIVEPTSTLIQYLAVERLSELLGLATGRLDNTITRLAVSSLLKRFYKQVRPQHTWLPMANIAGVLAESFRHLDRHPQGEAPLTIGSVLHTHRQGQCDGAVIVSPWGCAPALISESLLRHQLDIPMLFIYSDGTPMDDRRLDAFAFRLNRQPWKMVHSSRPG